MIHAADLPLWQQTDGAIEWIQEYVVSHNLALPTLLSPTLTTKKQSQPPSGLPRLPDTVNTAHALSAAQNEGIALTAEDLHEMYSGMFQTAFDIIREQQRS